MLPFNIDLLVPRNEDLVKMKPITSLGIMEGATKNFNPEGLFSTEIFGKFGEELRNRLFGYIDIKVPILHPIVFKALVELKQLYGKILSGNQYAIFDEETKDFILSTPIDGETGYEFFMKHFKDLVFEERDSPQRTLKIQIVNKYRDKAFITKVLVLPAGMRDYEVDEQGKPSEDEVNTHYRKLLSISNLISPAAMSNLESINNLRYSLQITFNTIFTYFETMLDGKHKLIPGKFASRKIFNGTRNVISSMIDNVENLHDSKQVDFNETVIGLYQFLKASLPLAMYEIKNGFLAEVFTGSNTPALLVNKNTLKKESVRINPDYYDKWMTEEGLEKTITTFAEESLRHNRIEIGDYYLGLIYKGPDGTYCLIHDIDDLELGIDVKPYVTPITYAELYYLSVYKIAKKLPGFVTRYPITGYGGIYPSKTYLKTTLRGESRKEIDRYGNFTGNEVNQFPIYGLKFINTLIVNPTHLKSLGADFDGDMCTYNILMTDEAIDEINNLFKKKTFYVNHKGKMSFSGEDDTISHVLMNMTGSPV